MVSLRELVREAIRRHNWALGKLGYTGHQGYKCPVDLYRLRVGDNTIDVHVQEDGVYRFYVSTEVYYNGKLLATGTFNYGMTAPIDVEVLFIPQLIIDLADGENVDTAMARFRTGCGSITLKQLEDAGLLGYMVSCPCW